VSNNCGVDEFGLGMLLREKRIRRTTGSYVGENREFARQYLCGELEVSSFPKARWRSVCAPAARAIAGFIRARASARKWSTEDCPFARPRRFVALASQPKEVRLFDASNSYWSERSPVTSPWCTRAVGDRHGKPHLRKGRQNFIRSALRRRVTIAEVERTRRTGEIDPAKVHTPASVQRVVVAENPEKRIERRTRSSASGSGAGN